MNDGQYTNIRNYLEELASQNRQLVKELQRTNELLQNLRRPEERIASEIAARLDAMSKSDAVRHGKPTAEPAKPSKPAVPRRMGPEPNKKPTAEPTVRSERVVDQPVEMAVKLPALDPNATQQGTTGKG